jgi:signal transduction histidine kinase
MLPSPRARDMILVAVLLIGSVVEVLTSDLPRWVVLPAALAAGALLWRRSAPTLTAAVVVTSATLVAVLAAPTQGSFTGFVAMVIALYSVGAHEPRRSGLYVLVAAIVGIAVAGLATNALIGGVNAGDWIPIGVWLSLAWALGTEVRRNRIQNEQLRVLAQQLADERDARAREAVSLERSRLARELHDVVAHNVSLMAVQAEGAGRVLQGDQPQVRAALAAIATTGRDTIDELRRLLGILRADEAEAQLAPQPGLADLAPLLDRVRGSGLAVDLTVTGDPIALPAGAQLSAFRIVQEALTNTLKHADASHVAVDLRYSPGAVEVRVADNGHPAGLGAGTGQGLVGLRERVALYGGSLTAGQDTNGYTVRALLPIGTTQ